MQKYYLTTPIYYVNAAPHIGHAYTTIVADLVKRFKAMQGCRAVLTTGSDEHGVNVERAAQRAGKSAKEYCDVIAAEFEKQWQQLGLGIDHFQRTTSPQHARVVQDLFERCRKNGYIYKGSYTGQYCIHDNLYVNEAKPGDPCPDCGRPTETITEENFFFKLSAFAERLLELYEREPKFIQPETRRNEVIAFVKQGLNDLSITRTTITWGIPVVGEAPHVFYVWFDALSTYMSAVEGEGLWPADLHLIGKEIVRFHAIYWPAFLMAAELPLPKRIFAHGWLLFEESKMSKSRGNIVRPEPIRRVMGVDALRYFLLREVVFGQDGSFSYDLARIAAQLGPAFAQRCAAHDGADTFVAENYEDLRKAKAFSAGVPAELGGGGASHRELSDFLRLLAHSCGSTALAFSMHTHLIALTAWRWKHEKAPVDGLLTRVANEELILVSSGGSDWLAASGTAEKADGGFKITARKIFSSGCPSGQLLMTSAVYQDPQQGAQVLHFPIDLKAPGVKIQDTWHTLGMRGTGSHDIVIDGVVVPEAAIGVRRPQGQWHPLFHLITMISLPVIYSVYFGLAEAARDVALKAAQKKRDNPDTQILVGELENELTIARLARDEMLDLAEHGTPGPETTSAMLIGWTLVGRHALATVDKAMEVAGGGSFFRTLGLERIYRDIQGARYHPLPEKQQQKLTGRMALGLPIDE